jgi:hypothetical protein
MLPSNLTPLCRRPCFWAAVLVGVLLRSVGLFQQVIVGDEQHAFRFALEHSLRQALVEYSDTANSPPLNAWLRLLLDLGWPPSELALRVPVLAAGLAMLLLVPRWIARRVDPRTAVWVAWLLATSPLLVFHSRFMRPYMPYALVTAMAAGAFFDWRQDGRLRQGLAYAGLGALAVYLHLLAAPFVLAPFAWLALEAALPGRRVVPPRRQSMVVAGLLGGLLILFLMPAWASIEDLLARRRQPLELGWRDFAAVPIRLSGSGVGWLTLLFCALALYGGFHLARSRPVLLRYGLCLVAVQMLTIPLLSPRYIANGLIFSRYLLPVLAPLLLAVGVGLATAPTARLTVAWRLAGAGFLAASFFLGPLADPEFYRNPFAVRPAALLRHRPGGEGGPVPDLYGRLQHGPPGAVIEAPTRPSEVYLPRLARYQHLHRRPALLSPGSEALSDPRLGLRSVVALEPERLLASRAAFLVVHRDWRRELGPGGRLGPSAPPELGRDTRRELADFRRQAHGLVRVLEATWGPPDFADDQLVTWDLERVRQATQVPDAR